MTQRSSNNHIKKKNPLWAGGLYNWRRTERLFDTRHCFQTLQHVQQQSGVTYLSESSCCISAWLAAEQRPHFVSFKSSFAIIAHLQGPSLLFYNPHVCRTHKDKHHFFYEVSQCIPGVYPSFMPLISPNITGETGELFLEGISSRLDSEVGRLLKLSLIHSFC